MRGSSRGHQPERWYNITHHFPYMSTGQTIKGLRSREMSSIPEGRKRRKRRGYETDLSGDLLDKCIVFTDMCRYPSVLMVGKAERTGALINCNNRYTVNLVIYLSWWKEADAQYLEAQTAARLMFKANMPLRRVYSSLLHVFPHGLAVQSIFTTWPAVCEILFLTFHFGLTADVQANKWKTNRTIMKKDCLKARGVRVLPIIVPSATDFINSVRGISANR